MAYDAEGERYGCKTTPQSITKVQRSRPSQGRRACAGLYIKRQLNFEKTASERNSSLRGFAKTRTTQLSTCSKTMSMGSLIEKGLHDKVSKNAEKGYSSNLVLIRLLNVPFDGKGHQARARRRILVNPCVSVFYIINIIASLIYCSSGIETYGAACHHLTGNQSECFCESLGDTDSRMGLSDLSITLEDTQNLTWPSTYFGKQESLYLVGDYIYYATHDSESGRTVFEICLDGYGDINFVSARTQIKSREGHWPIGPFKSRKDLSYAYLDVDSDSLKVQRWFRLWDLLETFAVDQNSWTKDSYDRDIVLLRQSISNPSIQNIFTIRGDETTVTRQPRFSKYLFKILNETIDDAIVSQPAIAGRYVIYNQAHSETGRVYTMLHDLETGYIQALGGESLMSHTKNQYHARIVRQGNANSGIYFSAWIEASNASLSLDRGILISEEDAVLFLMQLPECRKLKISAQDLASETIQVGSIYLWNYILTSSRIFFHVCTTEIYTSETVCQIRTCNLGSCVSSMKIALTTNSGQHVRFQDASSEYLLYFLGSEMHAIVDSHNAPIGEVPQHGCKFSNSTVNSNLVATTLYHDMVLLLYQDGKLYTFDLDKDNDEVIDVYDMFPYDGTEAFDSDNDGIGDSHDILNFTSHACASSQELRACLSDNVVLYLCFSFCYIILCTLCLRIVFATWNYLEHISQTIHYEVFVRHQEEMIKETADRAEAALKQESDRHKAKANDRLKRVDTLSSVAASLSTKGNAMAATQQAMAGMQSARSATSKGESNMSLEPSRDILVRYRRSPEMFELKEVANDILRNQEDAEALIPIYMQKCAGLVSLVMRDSHKWSMIVSDLMRAFLDVLAVISVVLSFIPLSYQFAYRMDPASLNLLVRFHWLEWTISSIFVARFFLSRRQPLIVSQHSPSRTALWCEILALITVPPGIKEYMSDAFMVTQILRCLIIFRVYRAYYRAFMERRLVNILINSPEYFLTVLILGFMVVCAFAVAQFESESDPEGLANFKISLWFSAVTITTVGYGDYAPLTQLGRTLSIFMMIFGVGLVGTISGSVAKAIQTVGSTEEKVKQLKADNRMRFEQYKDVFDISSLTYNPVLMSIAPIFIRGDLLTRALSAMHKGSPDLPCSLTSIAMRMSSTSSGSAVHRPLSSSGSSATASSTFSSRFMNGTQAPKPKRAFFPINLGVAELVAVNPQWKDETSLAEAASRVPPRRRATAMDKFMVHLADRSGSCPPKVRVLLLLQSFQLDSHPKVLNFAEFANSLCKIIFEPLRQNDSVLERSFALASDVKQLQKGAKSSQQALPNLDRYSIRDPLDQKLEKMEELLSSPQYGLLKRVDFALLLSELTLIVLEYERLEMSQWAFRNLRPKEGVTFPSPEHISKELYNDVQQYISTLADEDRQMTPNEFVDHLEAEAGVQKPGEPQNKLAMRIRRALEKVKSDKDLLNGARESQTRDSQTEGGQRTSNSGGNVPQYRPPQSRRRSVLTRILNVNPNSREASAAVAPVPEGIQINALNTPDNAMSPLRHIAMNARARIVRRSILDASGNMSSMVANLALKPTNIAENTSDILKEGQRPSVNQLKVLPREKVEREIEESSLTESEEEDATNSTQHSLDIAIESNSASDLCLETFRQGGDQESHGEDQNNGDASSDEGRVANINVAAVPFTTSNKESDDYDK